VHFQNILKENTEKMKFKPQYNTQFRDMIFASWHFECSSSVLNSFAETLMVAVTRWYRTKCPNKCDHFLIYCAPHLSSNHFRFIHQSSLLWLNLRHLLTNRGGSRREMAAEFCLRIPIIHQGFFNVP
jgi:hypothetical protein